MQLVWFKRDLRVHDNEALSRAAQAGSVLPLYVVEPELWREPDMSARQWGFLRDCLYDLRETLAGLGQPLVVRSGDVRAVLRDLDTQLGIDAVWSHQETGNAWTHRRDKAVAAWLHERSIPWHQLRQHGIVRGALDRDRWSAQWERLMRSPCHPSPGLVAVRHLEAGSIPDWPHDGWRGDDCPGRQRGGRHFAEQALISFLYERGRDYTRDMSSPRTAVSGCSRLSAHLACGTLSMRETVQTTRRRRSQLRGERPDWGRSLAAFEGRLHWHCHFMQKLESEPRLESEPLQPAMAGLRRAAPDPARLRAWAQGQTGWPLVDACMRFLAHHGWINFRMRAMLISVASYQLWMHWRPTGLHLARQFVDYEPGIHWSQTQMQSGTTGINSLRIYNPVKQSYDQDPHGRFIRTWVPELAAVDDAWIHAPWQMPLTEQRRTGVRIDVDYPAPLVDHEVAAREARKKIQQVRRNARARQQSRAIYQRHGSRRRPVSRQGGLFGDGS